MRLTGIKPNEAQLEELMRLRELVLNAPVPIISPSPDTTSNERCRRGMDLKNVCHAYALENDLPVLPGEDMYGLDGESGEFVAP